MGKDDQRPPPPPPPPRKGDQGDLTDTDEEILDRVWDRIDDPTEETEATAEE